MKHEKRTIITIFLLLIIISVFLVRLFRKSHAYIVFPTINYVYTNLDRLATLEDNDVPLSVDITPNDHLENLPLLRNCNELQTINIRNQEITDMSIFNEINSINELSLNIYTSNVDLSNLNMKSLSKLTIDSSFVNEIKSIENLTNLNTLKLISVSNYEDLVFSSFPNLKELELSGIYISDFDSLINNIGNIEILNLSGTNLDDSYISLISSLNNLKDLNMQYTHVTNIEPLLNVPNLEKLALPYSVKDISPSLQMNNLTQIVLGSEDYATDEYIEQMDQRQVGVYIIRKMWRPANLDEEGLLHDLYNFMDENGLNEEPEHGTLEYLNYVLKSNNGVSEILSKYGAYYNKMEVLYQTLDEHGYEYQAGYGIYINDNETIENKFVICVKTDGEVYYIIDKDNELVIAQEFNDYESYNENRVLFSASDLIKSAQTKNLLDLKKYSLKENYIVGISENTSIDELISNLGSDYDVKVFDANNNEKDNGIVGSGDKIRLYNANNIIQEFTAVVKGDCTGDGIVNLGDLNKLYFYIENMIELDGAFLEGCEIVENGEVNLGDLNKLYLYVSNIIDEL